MIFALLLLLGTASPVLAPTDSLRDAARDAQSAAYRYERLLLTTSPERYGGGSRDSCDERIGRFCFWYGTPGTPRRPIDPEAPEVAAARLMAIHAYRRWFALAPAEGRAAGPLIRYLIEAERAGEAAAAARTHVWASGSSLESLLFLGLALHYTRDFPAAEEAFDRARALATERERRRLDDISVLLEHGEHSRYRGLSGDARAEYEAAFWALSDPWYMDAGNERRSAHYARHAWSRIFAGAPRVEGRMRWGDDHTEILLRYGLPTGRQRNHLPSASIERRTNLMEWFDPRRVALSPEGLLTAGVPATPPAGVRPEIERDTARSAYAPLGQRRTWGLQVQPSVFPGRDGGVVRVDALLPADSVDPRLPVRPRGLVVLLDTLGREIGRVSASPRVRDDSVTVVSAELPVSAGVYVYRVEIRDDSTGLGGMAQYRIDVAGISGLTLSDLLISIPPGGAPPAARNDAALEATPGLVLPPAQDVGVYAEVSGLDTANGAASLGVEWWIERADEGGLLQRAARWLGQRVGLVGEEQPTRVAWVESADGGDVQSLFVTLSLGEVEPGLHVLGLVVRDRVSGQERTSTRLIRIDPAARPLPRRDQG